MTQRFFTMICSKFVQDSAGSIHFRHVEMNYVFDDGNSSDNNNDHNDDESNNSDQSDVNCYEYNITGFFKCPAYEMKGF